MNVIVPSHVFWTIRGVRQNLAGHIVLRQRRPEKEARGTINRQQVALNHKARVVMIEERQITTHARAGRYKYSFFFLFLNWPLVVLASFRTHKGGHMHARFSGTAFQRGAHCAAKRFLWHSSSSDCHFKASHGSFIRNSMVKTEH